MQRAVNWALVGTGSIVKKFLAGLRAAEGAHAAAVVSRTKENADRFAAQYGIGKAYASYEDMLNDSAIDVVYIGTPHTTHKDYAVRALKAKKAVLCEKPVSINAGELGEMIKTARENGVFFMEAMWTRFLPPLYKVREWISGGLIGDVRMVQASFCFNSPWNPAGRLLDINMGGGSLLDAGVYPISLASMAFGGRKSEGIRAFLGIGKTGVDEEFAGIISWGEKRLAQVCSALFMSAANDAWIYGSQGRIHIPGFVFAHSADLIHDGRLPYHYEPNFVSNGYNYQAEEVMRCIREGKLESEIMPQGESLNIMEIMDEARSQWGFKYPGE
ncbi:MAG: Gfo/Idh/MocA family oxidoreductase [Treponema sp.]|jgi:predicted dehydrogenase|nr:Gfo/Idh/MocA family oxidoreductase [Treponema sp.]